MWFSVKKLQKECDPFLSSVWEEGRLTVGEIKQAIEDGRLCDEVYSRDMVAKDWSWDMHVERVAYLVMNPSDKAIEVDLGCPSLGCHVDWPVTDGNHRLAAAIYRGDEKILVEPAGEVRLINKMKWKPKVA